MKFSKKIISAILAIVLIISSLSISAFASEISDKKENVPLSELQASADDFISFVTEELRRESTDVITELESLNAKYSALLLNADEETAGKLQALITTTNELIHDYTFYENSTRGSFHLIYSAEVAAAISAFNLLGYDLSAELLIHARDNDALDSFYSPVLGSDVTVSSVFTNIKNGSTNSGSASFPNSGTTDEKDLYYSIHSFNYRKSNSGRVVIIEDRYDYAQGSMGSSITGMVVNEMYKAQEAGVIVPYYTYIVEKTTKSAQNQFETVSIDSVAERRMLYQNVVLGHSEYKEYTMTFDTSGYKVFQTFGNLDTKIEIFNAQGTSLTNGSGDDNGYSTNSMVRYYCTAGTTYKVRVSFFSSSRAGEFMFAVTPANGVLNSGSSTLSSYEDIWAVTGYTGYTFNTWTVLNQTKFLTFTAPSSGEYTFEITSEYDTYIYVIDPRSFSMWKDDRDFNDDDGEGLNPKIVRELETGVPYLVVYSSYNIQNSSAIGNISVHIGKN